MSQLQILHIDLLLAIVSHAPRPAPGNLTLTRRRVNVAMTPLIYDSVFFWQKNLEHSIVNILPIARPINHHLDREYSIETLSPGALKPQSLYIYLFRMPLFDGTTNEAITMMMCIDVYKL